MSLSASFNQYSIMINHSKTFLRFLFIALITTGVNYCLSTSQDPKFFNSSATEPDEQSEHPRRRYLHPESTQSFHRPTPGSHVTEDDRKSDPGNEERTTKCTETILKDMEGIVTDLKNKQNRREAVPEGSQQQFYTRLNEFQHFLKIEGLGNPNLNYRCRSMQEKAKQGKWAEVEEELAGVASQIRVFDTQKMTDLLIHDAQNAMHEVVDQDVCILVGETGVGKSLTTLFLKGVSLKLVEIGNRKYIAPDPNVQLDEELQKIVVSPLPTSQTQQITPIQVKLLDERNPFSNSPESITICDVPGFGDTGGAEVAVAHALNLRKMVNKCSSVRFIVIISPKSMGERCKGIRGLALLLSHMVTDFQEHKSAFSYLFTKFGEIDKQNLLQDLLDIFSSMNEEEKSVPGFQDILRDMGEKLAESLERPYSGSAFLDPLKDEREQVLKMLLRSTPIQNPQEVIQPALMQETTARINKQVAQYEKSITHALQHHCYDLVSYKLSQLQQLAEHLVSRDIHNIYQQCVQQVADTMNTTYRQACDQLHHYLEGNRLTGEMVKSYKAAYLQASEGDQLIKQYLWDHEGDHRRRLVGYSDQYLQNLDDEVKAIASRLEKRVITDKDLAIDLDMLQVIGTYFQEVHQKPGKVYITSRQSVEQLIQTEIDAAQDAIQQNNISRVAQHMKGLKKAAAIVQAHIPTCQERYEQLRQNFWKHLQELRDHILTTAEKPDLNVKDIDSLNQGLQLLRQVQQTCMELLGNTIDTPPYQEALNKLVARLEQCAAAIDADLEQKEVPDFKAIETPLKLLYAIYTITDIQQHLQATNRYHETIRKLEFYITRLEADATKSIEHSFATKDVVSLQPYIAFLTALQEAKWIDKFCKGNRKEVLKNVTETIDKQVQALTHSLQGLYIDWGNFEDLERLSEVLSKAQVLDALKRLVPEVAKQLEHIEKATQTYTAPIFKEIEELINLTISDVAKENYTDSNESKETEWIADHNLLIASRFWYCEQALDFLKRCERLRVLRDDQILLGAKLRKQIRTYGDHLGSEMNQSLRTMEHVLRSRDQGEDVEQLTQEWGEAVNRVADGLREINRVENDFKQVYRCFTGDLLPTYERNMIAYAKNARKFFKGLELEEDQLIIWLPRLQCLTEWDSWLEKQHERGFQPFYQELREKLSQHYGIIYQQILNMIESRDYANIPYQLAGVQGIQKKELIKKLFYSLRQLQKKTTKDANILTDYSHNIDSLKNIMENLRNLEEATTHISSLLELKDQKAIQQTIIGVKEIIARRVQAHVDETQKLLQNYQFAEAGKNIKLLKKIYDLVGDIVGLQTYLTHFEGNMKEVFEKLAQQYKNAQLGELSSIQPSLKKIFNQLHQAEKEDTCYECYTEGLVQIIRGHFEATEDKMQHLKTNYKYNLNIQIAKELIELEKGVKKFLSCLPVTYNNDEFKDIATRIKETREQIDQEQKKDLNGKLKRGDLIGARKLWDYYKDPDDHERIKAIEDTIEEHFCTHLKSIEQIWDAKRAVLNHGLIHNCSLLRDYSIHFGGEISFIGKQIEWIQGNFNCVMQKIVDEFKSALQFRNTASLVKWFDYFALLRELQRTLTLNRVPEAASALFSTTFERSVDEVHRILGKDLLAKQDAFENSGKDLKKNLDLVKDWEEFLEKVTKYLITFRRESESMCFLGKTKDKLWSYDKIVSKVQKDLDQQKNKIIKLELINDHTKQSKVERDKFYEELNKSLCLLAQFNDLDSYFNASQYHKDAKEALTKKLEGLRSDYKRILKQIDIRRDRGELYEALNVIEVNLTSFKEWIDEPSLHGSANECKKDLTDSLEQYLAEQVKKTRRDISNPELFCEGLVLLKGFSQVLTLHKQGIDKEMNQLLKEYKNKQNRTDAIVELSFFLEEEPSGIGASIVRQYAVFKGRLVAMFNERTQGKDIEYVLSNLDGDNVDLEQLRFCYSQFETIYNDYYGKYWAREPNLDGLVREVQRGIGKTGHIPFNKGQLQWDRQRREKALPIMAGLFAWWTLSRVTDCFDNQEQEIYLTKPHAAQVISTLRMLNFDTPEEQRSIIGNWKDKGVVKALEAVGNKAAHAIGQLKGKEDYNQGLVNNLVQIETGQGKTITLAVIATTLALMGCEVNCACYSRYLSERDYENSRKMFNAFGVEDKIHYGTFQRLCERVINQNGNVREQVEQIIIRKKEVSNVQRNSNRPKILLIDEVDVFFNEDFYGNTYRPFLRLRDPMITNLVHEIWNNRRANLNHARQQLQQSRAYQDCCNKFPQWSELIKEASKSMIADVRDFQSPVYFVHEDQIAYTKHGIMTNLVYGYSTLFAYFHEHEQGHITQKSRDENICLYINCGNFSYAAIPSQFTVIMGVTGTLKELNQAERSIIRDKYSIRKMTYAPSVFGANSLTFGEAADVHIENSDDYFRRIYDEICSRKAASNSQLERPIIVFFEDEKQLLAFRGSTWMSRLRDEAKIMTEKLNAQERSSLVNTATFPGRVTLCTKTYGRGTDFLCSNKVNDAGGPHVLQTFFSERATEERQIKGRTARQGGKGSYSMVLNQADLEKFKVSQQDIEAMRSHREYFNTLNEKREAFAHEKYANRDQVVEQTLKAHEISQRFLNDLQSGDEPAVKTYLCEVNACPPVKASSRTIVLMDATGSMSSLLEKCKTTLRIMFGRATGVLHDHGISEGSFEMQLAVYRNYNCDAHTLLESSGWENKPENLCTFMNRISSQGGMGNEAIEIGLWHVNQEATKREDLEFQCILIGDMPPNTQQEVSSKRDGSRQGKGESYWRGTRFALPTYYEDELQGMIKSRNIPIHAFFVRSSARNKFQEIAQATGGRYEELNINSPQGGERLTSLVTEEILRKAGGAQGGQLVEAYRKKYAMYAA